MLLDMPDTGRGYPPDICPILRCPRRPPGPRPLGGRRTLPYQTNHFSRSHLPVIPAASSEAVPPRPSCFAFVQVHDRKPRDAAESAGRPSMSRLSVMWNESSRRSVGISLAMVAEIFEQEVTQVVGSRGVGGSSLVSRSLPTTRQGGLETTPRFRRTTGQLPGPTPLLLKGCLLPDELRRRR